MKIWFTHRIWYVVCWCFRPVIRSLFLFSKKIIKKLFDCVWHSRFSFAFICSSHFCCNSLPFDNVGTMFVSGCCATCLLWATVLPKTTDHDSKEEEKKNTTKSSEDFSKIIVNLSRTKKKNEYAMKGKKIAEWKNEWIPRKKKKIQSILI